MPKLYCGKCYQELTTTAYGDMLYVDRCQCVEQDIQEAREEGYQQGYEDGYQDGYQEAENFCEENS
jgi:hypothetical protein